ncbi:hypothetical protein ECG_09322 [Echinococcus granulosus]|nr:hypothetical protein ECG_09322 [Echinococcus granulosus]
MGLFFQALHPVMHAKGANLNRIYKDNFFCRQWIRSLSWSSPDWLIEGQLMWRACDPPERWGPSHTSLRNSPTWSRKVSWVTDTVGELEGGSQTPTLPIEP